MFLFNYVRYKHTRIIWNVWASTKRWRYLSKTFWYWNNWYILRKISFWNLSCWLSIEISIFVQIFQNKIEYRKCSPNDTGQLSNRYFRVLANTMGIRVYYVLTKYLEIVSHPQVGYYLRLIWTKKDYNEYFQGYIWAAKRVTGLWPGFMILD